MSDFHFQNCWISDFQKPLYPTVINGKESTQLSIFSEKIFFTQYCTEKKRKIMQFNSDSNNYCNVVIIEKVYTK